MKDQRWHLGPTRGQGDGVPVFGTDLWCHASRDAGFVQDVSVGECGGRSDAVRFAVEGGELGLMVVHDHSR